jgi:1-acyl-sn-glycerol-3-phosphate acyltransferase
MTGFLQFIYFCIFHWPLRLLLRAKVKVPEGIVIEKNKPLILALNHPSRLDPFLLGLLPWRLFKQIMPVYFLTANQYYQHWWLRIFIKPVGAYPLQEKAWTLEEFLGTTLAKLSAGQKVMVFPEGQLTKWFDPDNAKPGIVHMAMKSGARILPIHIQGIFGVGFWDTVFRKRTGALSLGQPFVFSGKIATSEEAARAAADIVRRIYEL